jgi:hypothetical protein
MKEKRLQLVTFRQARRLRALGFKYPVDYYFQLSPGSFSVGRTNEATNMNDRHQCGISAPSVALALKWFRDEKEVTGGVILKRWKYGWYYIGLLDNTVCDSSNVYEEFDSYEAAESALLDEFLSIIEKNEPVH